MNILENIKLIDNSSEKSKNAYKFLVQKLNIRNEGLEKYRNNHIHDGEDVDNRLMGIFKKDQRSGKIAFLDVIFVYMMFFFEVVVKEVIDKKSSECSELKNKYSSLSNKLQKLIILCVNSIIPPDGQKLEQNYAAVTTRLKIMSELDISERRLPQDGAINFRERFEDIDIDIRLSILPNVRGERVVMRLLIEIP